MFTMYLSIGGVVTLSLTMGHGCKYMKTEKRRNNNNNNNFVKFYFHEDVM